MPRGGARENTGPDPVLDELAQLHIGAAIQTEWFKASNKKAKAAHANPAIDRKPLEDFKTARKEWLEEWVRATTPAARRELKETELTPKDWLKAYEGQNYLEDLKADLQAAQGISDDREPTRLRQVAPKRPKGVLKNLIREAAEHFGISERMARRCLEKYRKFALPPDDV